MRATFFKPSQRSAHILHGKSGKQSSSSSASKKNDMAAKHDHSKPTLDQASIGKTTVTGYSDESRNTYISYIEKKLVDDKVDGSNQQMSLADATSKQITNILNKLENDFESYHGTMIKLEKKGVTKKEKSKLRKTKRDLEDLIGNNKSTDRFGFTHRAGRYGMLKDLNRINEIVGQELCRRIEKESKATAQGDSSKKDELEDLNTAWNKYIDLTDTLRKPDFTIIKKRLEADIDDLTDITKLDRGKVPKSEVEIDLTAKNKTSFSQNIGTSLRNLAGNVVKELDEALRAPYETLESELLEDEKSGPSTKSKSFNTSDATAKTEASGERPVKVTELLKGEYTAEGKTYIDGLKDTPDQEPIKSHQSLSTSESSPSLELSKPQKTDEKNRTRKNIHHLKRDLRSTSSERLQKLSRQIARELNVISIKLSKQKMNSSDVAKELHMPIRDILTQHYPSLRSILGEVPSQSEQKAIQGVSMASKAWVEKGNLHDPAILTAITLLKSAGMNSDDYARVANSLHKKIIPRPESITTIVPISGEAIPAKNTDLSVSREPPSFLTTLGESLTEFVGAMHYPLEDDETSSEEISVKTSSLTTGSFNITEKSMTETSKSQEHQQAIKSRQSSSKDRIPFSKQLRVRGEAAKKAKVAKDTQKLQKQLTPNRLTKLSQGIAKELNGVREKLITQEISSSDVATELHEPIRKLLIQNFPRLKGTIGKAPSTSEMNLDHRYSKTIADWVDAGRLDKAAISIAIKLTVPTGLKENDFENIAQLLDKQLGTEPKFTNFEGILPKIEVDELTQTPEVNESIQPSILSSLAESLTEFVGAMHYPLEDDELSSEEIPVRARSLATGGYNITEKSAVDTSKSQDHQQESIKSRQSSSNHRGPLLKRLRTRGEAAKKAKVAKDTRELQKELTTDRLIKLSEGIARELSGARKKLIDKQINPSEAAKELHLPIRKLLIQNFPKFKGLIGETPSESELKKIQSSNTTSADWIEKGRLDKAAILTVINLIAPAGLANSDYMNIALIFNEQLGKNPQFTSLEGVLTGKKEHEQPKASETSDYEQPSFLTSFAEALHDFVGALHYPLDEEDEFYS